MYLYSLRSYIKLFFMMYIVTFKKLDVKNNIFYFKYALNFFAQLIC